MTWVFIVVTKLLTLGFMAPLTGLQDREAVGAEWDDFLLWTYLHSSRGNRARAHKDVLQERSVSEPSGRGLANDLCHR